MTQEHREPPFKSGDRLLRQIEIRRLIGRGGQGYVYEGFHELLDHEVAVKAIPDTSERAVDLRQRAKMEARILFRLRHPNVVQVFAADVLDQGIVCIVMEMLTGRSLRAALNDVKQFNVDEALLIGTQIADGMRAAHELQAIHRDLKPDNVFIEPGNVAKILDFGIAKITGFGAITTRQEMIQGTLQYMSPEHLQGKPVTAQSDIFALGCMLYELIAGRAPATMSPEAITRELIGWNQITRMPPRLDKVIGGVPAEVGRLIKHMIAKEPANRPATMAEVATQLRSLHTHVSKLFSQPPRELWRPGQGGLRSPIEPAIPMATTTVPDAVYQGSAATERTPQASQDRAQPMPLLTRGASLQSRGAAKLPRSGDSAQRPARAAEVVARAENRVRHNAPRTSPAAGVPVTVTASKMASARRSRALFIGAAIAVGVVLGAVILYAGARAQVPNSPGAAAEPSMVPPRNAAVQGAAAPGVARVAARQMDPRQNPTSANSVSSVAGPTSAPASPGNSREPANAPTTETVSARKASTHAPARTTPKPPFSADDLTF